MTSRDPGAQPESEREVLTKEKNPVKVHYLRLGLVDVVLFFTGPLIVRRRGKMRTKGNIPPLQQIDERLDESTNAVNKPNETCAMDIKTFKLLHPVKYYKDYLENNIRPDGRELEELRPTAFSFGVIQSADGSAIAKIGNTTVVCGIKAELAAPKAVEPNQGYLIPNVEISPVSSPSYRPGPPSEEAQVYSQSLADVFSKARCIDLAQLCVEPGKLVWVLYCDLVCLDHDGCVFDAAVAALVAALHTVKLPKIVYNSDTGETEVDRSSLSALTVRCIPVTTSFVVIANRTIVDPTAEEEKLAGTILTITISAGKLSFVTQSGGQPMDHAVLKKCTESATQRERSVKKMIMKMQQKQTA